MPTAVSLFSGCGGFDLGATQAGVKILWANDINSHAASTYRRYFPDVEFVQGDIRQIDKTQIPEADLLIGCYPCQGFSNAAWRRWRGRKERDLFENKDNFLYLEFGRSIPYVKPKFIFIENVSGLQSSAGGWFFEAQRGVLDLAGYKVYHAPLDTKDFGLPQSRKRVFIVGVRNDISFEYSFPEKTHGPGRTNPYKSQLDCIAGLPMWPIGDFEDTPFHGHYLTRNRKRRWAEYSYTIVAHSHHVTLHPMGEAMKKVGKDKWMLQGPINRRLSWRECGVLQSFSKDFEPDGPIAAKYLQIGNSVPPLMAELIVKPVVEFLNASAK